MTTSPLPHPDALPARFIVERRLGEGIAATTYLARDQKLDRMVVIKSVHGRGTPETAARTRFEREARAAAAINHPNVVGVYDYGTHRGRDYLVLRYVEGETLRQQMTRRGRFGAESAVRIAGQILAGLGAIHGAGLVHRDVKPENVIVGSDGFLRITDFGIAVASTDPRLTTHGEIWGTPSYMAPEQALGRAVSAATDVYAVGIVLFELLTGRLPFEGHQSAVVALAQVSVSPPSLHEANPKTDASAELEAVLRRALEKDPADRFQSAAQMAEALVAAAPTAVPSRVADESHPTVPIRTVRAENPPDDEGPIVRRPVRRSNRPRWAIAALLALVVGAGIFRLGAGPALGFWSDKDDTPTAGFVIPKLDKTSIAAATFQPTATTAPSLTPTPTVTQAVSAPVSTQIPVRETVSDSAPTVAPVSIEPTEPATISPTSTPKRKKPKAKATSTPKPDQVIEPIETPAAAFESAGHETPTRTVQSVSQTFTMSDWAGGFVGNQAWYGRPWIALYGAQSQYPAATISFTLDQAPSGDTTIAIDGLDDEWAGNVSIAVSVNGLAVYSGASPWASWNGEGQGENANWTTATFAIPAGTLVAGSNQVLVENTEQTDNFGTAPYVLLSGGSIQSGP